MIARRLSHFEIEAEIGAGGMGVVYRAKDLRLRRTVALKVLPPHLLADPSQQERFLREARAASALNHPNIVTVYEVDTSDGVDFIAMEYLEGKSLDQLIGAGSLDPARALRYARQIAEGLAAAHGRGITHRDVKPRNILVTLGDTVKILDFGLANVIAPQDPDSEALTQSKITGPGHVLGTVAYMSPEQARGQKLDARSDIFSFGIVFYEMLAGQGPFRGQSAAEVLSAILRDKPPPLRTARPDLPGGIERIVDKALEKDPDYRYQDMREVLADLKRLERDAGPAVVPGAAVRPAHRPGRQRGRALAVLPLANLSRDPEQEYFADGMTDELIAQLAQIRALRVTSRTSAMRYKGTNRSMPEIARDLQVDTVVEGSVLRSGDRVRITAQLIHAPTDRHLWAQSFERDCRDVLRLQSEVARAIAHEIQVRLTPQERSRLKGARAVDPEAHDAYLKGRFFWNKFSEGGFTKAMEYFQQATEKDPTHAGAHAGLADCLMMLGWYSFVAPHEAFPRARAAAAKALEIDNALAEAHVSLALVKWVYEWDWLGGGRAHQRAIELNPSHANAHQQYSWYLAALGRHEEAMTEATRALELDPLSLGAAATVGIRSYDSRQYDKAIEQLLLTLEMDSSFMPAHLYLGRACVQKGMHTQALAAFQKLVDSAGQNPHYLAALAYAHAAAGQRVPAQELIAQLEELSNTKYVSAYQMAAIYAALRDGNEALRRLETAYEEHSALLCCITIDPLFDFLRADQRFRDLLRRMNFPD